MKTLSLLLSLCSLLAVAVSTLQAQTTLYSTTFPSPPFVQNQAWAGIDGWIGIGTSNAQDDAILDVGGGELGGLLGFDNGNDETFLSVYRPVPFNPVAAGQPIVTITTRVGFQKSDNGNDDTFSFAIFNQNTDILAEVFIDLSDGSILYNDGSTTTDTGGDLNNFGFADWVFTIDFQNNTWSLTVDGFPVFLNITFTDPGRAVDLDLGSFDFRWDPTDPMNSGNNYLVADDVSIIADTRFDFVPTLSTRKKVRTKRGRVTIKGTAADDKGVAAVRYKGTKGGFKNAKGTTSWSYRARVKPGRNRFTVQAIDSRGQGSAPVVVKVIRR